MDVGQFLELSNEATSVDELYKYLEQVLRDQCGYDRVIFSLMSDHRSLRLKAGHGIMRNYPDDWMKYYVEHGYEHIDPVRRFGFTKVGPFIWDRIPLVLDLSPRESLCLNQGREAGLHNGAAICLRGLLGEFAGVAGASSAKQGRLTEKDLKHRISILNMISQQFYAAFCHLHERKTNLKDKQIMLTNKEIEILNLLSMAKTDQDIAVILGISVHTVSFHIRNLLAKFNTSSRTTVVLQAVQAGFIRQTETVFLRAHHSGPDDKLTSSRD